MEVSNLNNQTQGTPKLIRIDEVKLRTGLGKSTILAWEASGRFPKAIRLSKTLRLWLEADINEWINNLRLTSHSSLAGKAV